jgi:outer membrane protein OmpA-like peptidoglycan-associated protein
LSGWVLAALLSAAPSTSFAQQARDGEIAVNRFEPAPGRGNFITVERARVAEGAASLGLVVDGSHDPFRLRHCLPAACSAPGARVERVEVVRSLVAAHLLGAMSVTPRLQLGLRLPIEHAGGDGIVTDRASTGFGGPAPGGLSATAVGDPMLEAKVRAVGDVDSAFVLGGALSATAPLGHALADGSYLGDSSPTVGVRLIADGQSGRLSYGANAGALFRKKAHLGTLDLGPEARAGVGVGVEVTTALRVVGEVFGASNLTGDAGTSAAEADAALQVLPRNDLTLMVGGGAGLNQGFGAPMYRGFLGIAAAFDRTPERAAVAPDPDPDHDGVLEPDDKCPREGGDVVRLPGPYLGCPKRDSDEDGVLDHVDACPTVPGVASQDPAANGCPSQDRDNDGIPNDRDKCPDQPETVNGYQDEDGCPDAPPAIIVEVRQDQIVVINEHINFEFNSDRIAGARSFEALDLVAQALQKHPEIRKLEVAGHTDDVGPRDENLAISKRRAATVVSYFVTKGIAADRLRAAGYGPDKPVAANGTAEGRAANRRVQFDIVVFAK